jgi:phosphate starvation-inducible membrane PsiE
LLLLLKECLTDLRQNVATLGTAAANTNLASSSATMSAVQPAASERKLQYLHETTFKSITEQIKNVLVNLQAFIASDISFSAKVHFNEPFCKDYVRERLLVPYLKYIALVCKEFADGSHDPVPYALLLILTKLCLDFESAVIDYLVSSFDFRL